MPTSSSASWGTFNNTCPTNSKIYYNFFLYIKPNTILYFYNFLKGGCFGQRRFGLYDALVCGEQPVLGAETFVAFAHDGLLHQTQFFLAMGAFGFLRHVCPYI